MSLRGRYSILLLALALLGWGIVPGSAEVTPTFFAIGEPVGSKEQGEAVVYRVAAGSGQVLASRRLGKPFAEGQLSGTGTRLYLLVFENFIGDTVLALNASDLSLLWKYTVNDSFRLSERATVSIALRRIFVHPETERIYLTNDTGFLPNRVYILDSRKRELERILYCLSGAFTFDRARNRLYLGGGAGVQDLIWMIDLTTHAAGPQRDLPLILDLLVVPKSEQFLLVVVSPTEAGSDHYLALYDTSRHSIVHQSRELGFAVIRGVGISSDGTRLLGVTSPYGSHGAGVIIDLPALSIRRRLTFSEPVDHFVSAPDGRGMWMVAESGKVYRLDDQSGQVLEQVSLSFRLRKVITPP